MGLVPDAFVSENEGLMCTENIEYQQHQWQQILHGYALAEEFRNWHVKHENYHQRLKNWRHIPEDL